MARRANPKRQLSGLYYAREARGMSRTELVKRSGVSKQQLSRLENGHIRMRLDHLKPFASVLGYSPEQILLWGRFPGAGDTDPAAARAGGSQRKSAVAAHGLIPEIDVRSEREKESTPRKVRKDGRHADPIKSEGWLFPTSLIRDQLHATIENLLVIDVDGDAMAPTVKSGDRVVVDTEHKSLTSDGLYGIRDAFGSIIVRRLQMLRAAKPARVKIICDNSNHATEEAALNDLEIVGKVVCCLKIF